jgi:hypothetical protein
VATRNLDRIRAGSFSLIWEKPQSEILPQDSVQSKYTEGYIKYKHWIQVWRIGDLGRENKCNRRGLEEIEKVLHIWETEGK